jgi:hypothetical protein
MWWMVLACNPDPRVGMSIDTDLPVEDPDIFVEQEAVDFGRMPSSGEAHRPLTIVNAGGGRLNVFAITLRDTTSIAIEADEDFFLGEDEALDVDLVWSPSDDLVATIEIVSNDPDERLVEVPVEGEVTE